MWMVAGSKTETHLRGKKSRLCALFLFSVAPVAGYTKLGSTKPEVCRPESYDCPSHMACVPGDHGTFHCICDRFLGFRGKSCREHSRASWLLLALSIFITLWAFWLLFSNITLAFELKDAGRLKANSNGRTLFFNSLSTLPVITLAIGFALTVVGAGLGVDPHMEFYQHGRPACIVGIYLFYFLSTLSVSVVWIIDVKKLASMGLGAGAARAKKRQERVYLTAFYIISLSGSAFTLFVFFFSKSAVQTVSLMGVTLNIITGGSYYYAGRRVIRDLRVVEVRSSMREVGIAQIAQKIRKTSQIMTRLSFGMSAGFIGLYLTIISNSPVLPCQNALPRVLQGQLFYFLAQGCGLGVNQLIVEYMQHGSSTRHLKLWSATVSALWYGSLPPDIEKTVRTHVCFNLYGHDSQNQRIVKVAVEKSESEESIFKPQLSSVHSAGAKRYLPVMLATLHTQGVDDHGDALSVETPEPRPRMRGKTVMDIGGVVVNLDAVNMAKEELEVPNKGSHAFVRCFGENHLRCTWHTFEFGFAGGHELLANRSAVLMEGEVEVDEDGFVTRWLHKSGVNTAPLLGLNMPPRWVVRLLGFPSSATWLTVAGTDVKALAEDFKASLVSKGHLIRLDSSNTQPIIPAPAARFVSSFSAAFATFKTSSTRILDVPKTRQVAPQDSFVSDISSLSAASIDWDDSHASPGGSWGHGGVEACVVPGTATHAEEKWIMKVDVWKTSPLQSAFVSVRDSLASFRLKKSYSSESRSVRFKVEPEELGSHGGSSESDRKTISHFSDEGRFGHPHSVSGGIDGIHSPEPETSWTEISPRMHAAVLPPLRTAAKKSRNMGPPPLLIIKVSKNRQTSSRPRPISSVQSIEESEVEDDLDDDDDKEIAMVAQEVQVSATGARRF